MVDRIKNPRRFVELLQKRWANLVFARVREILECDDQYGTRYHFLFKDGSFSEAPMYQEMLDLFKKGQTTYKTGSPENLVEHNFEDVDEMWEEKLYGNFLGYSQVRPADDNSISFQEISKMLPKIIQPSRSKYPPIYFDQKNYSGINFDQSCWFGNTNNKFGDSNLPKEGDLICGVVTKDKGKLSFDRWFISTPQFYNLWKLVVLRHCSTNIEDTPEFRNLFYPLTNQDLVLDRLYRKKNADEYRCTRDEILRNFDPDEARYGVNQHFSYFDEILSIYLKCRSKVPCLDRTKLPKITQRSVDRAYHGKRHKFSNFRIFFGQSWGDNNFEKNLNIAPFLEEITQDNSFEVSFYGEPCLVKYMVKLMADEQCDFANIFSSYTYRKHLKLLFDY